MTAEERERVLTGDLAELSNREAARALGVHKATIWKVRNPERYREGMRIDNARRSKAKRAHERSAKGRGTCERCGKLRGVNCATKGVTKLCRECVAADRQAARDSLAYRIAAWRVAGFSLDEMAARLGYANRHVLGGQIARLRRAGYDIPYAYTNGGPDGSKYVSKGKEFRG